MSTYTPAHKRAQARTRLRSKGLPYSGRFVSTVVLNLWIARNAALKKAQNEEAWDALEGLRKILHSLEEEMAAALTPEERREWARGLVAK